MKINRRDVVNVIFGSNTRDNHLVIVLSPEEVNSEEEQFLGMMITDSKYFDPNNDFSFPLNDSMFLNPLKSKESKARLFLINFLKITSIVDKSKFNEMKKDAFEKLIKELNEKVFGIALK